MQRSHIIPVLKTLKQRYEFLRYSESYNYQYRATTLNSVVKAVGQQ